MLSDLDLSSIYHILLGVYLVVGSGAFVYAFLKSRETSRTVYVGTLWGTKVRILTENDSHVTPLFVASLRDILMSDFETLGSSDEINQQVANTGPSGAGSVGGQVQQGDGGYFGYWPPPASKDSAP